MASVIAKLKVTPFITTLGSMIIIYGLSSMYVDREPMVRNWIGGLATSLYRVCNRAVFASVA